MFRRIHLILIPLVVCVMACSSWAKPKEVTDPAEAQKDPDFAVQGEYVGEGELPDGTKDKVGAQVVAQGQGKFKVVVTKGGLPGAGWNREDARFFMDGQRDGDVTKLEGRKLNGKIVGGTMTIVDPNGKECIKLEKTERKSPTLEAKAPEGAIVIFDGKNTDQFQHGKMTPEGNLWSDAETKPLLDSCKLHLEFRLSWMPDARGQGRSNSGVYLHSCYECQVLDSFGLEGRNNECGGFYQVAEPKVNMCLPPLEWQTYDIELTAPEYKDGEKVKNARATVVHNGVVIHKDLELPHATPGRMGEGPGPRPLYLQGHGNKVQYRNIWAVPK